MDSNTKPTVNCVFFPMDGLKGEEAAASQTSRSGLDMSAAGNGVSDFVANSREAALVAFGARAWR